MFNLQTEGFPELNLSKSRPDGFRSIHLFTVDNLKIFLSSCGDKKMSCFIPSHGGDCGLCHKCRCTLRIAADRPCFCLSCEYWFCPDCATISREGDKYLEVKGDEPLMSTIQPYQYMSQRYCPQFNPDTFVVEEPETYIMQPALGLCRSCRGNHLPRMLAVMSSSLLSDINGIVLEYYGILNIFLILRMPAVTSRPEMPPLLKSNEITYWLNSEMELFELYLWQSYVQDKPRWLSIDISRTHAYERAEEKCEVASVISKYRRIFSEGVSREEINAETDRSPLWTGLIVNSLNEVAALSVRARTHEIAKLKLFEQMVIDIGPGDEYSWNCGHEEMFEALRQVKLEVMWKSLRIEWFMP